MNIYVSKYMSGKMQGIHSISTSVLANPVCRARRKNPNSICSHCYAVNTLNRYHAAERHYAENFHLLNDHLLTAGEIPVINASIFRLESFGDLASPTQAENYLRIASANPWCTFAIWTKNPGFMDKAIRRAGKPKNLICILSSEKLNCVSQAYRNYAWVDHVFTVYDKEHKPDAEINCGARSCMGCRRCYTLGNEEFFISERLK